MSDQSKIIETELPPCIDQLVFLRSDTLPFEVKRAFIAAQRSAIMRFCEAVEKEAGNALVIQAVQSGKMLNLKYAHAMKKLRDELATKEEV